MILNFKKTFIQKTYLSVDLLGKNLKLNIKYSKIDRAEVNRLENEISITLPMRYRHSDNMDIINLCIQKLYNFYLTLKTTFATAVTFLSIVEVSFIP